QLAYNKKHGITPQTIKKNIKDITETLQREEEKAVGTLFAIDMAQADTPKALKALIIGKREQMADAVEKLDFETAAILRDEIKKLEGKLPEEKKLKRRSRWPKKGIVVDLED
ncbi:MAG: UvrB/UvrC motif-containing protein, partial [bacterium]|nr:UvrB/UvrC motif-containing protein [bacterium]